MLQKNGQPISLTLHGLKDKNHFRANLAKAIERGLAKRDALAALTTAPAKLTGVSDQLGTIETGKLANLVVVEGDYFDPKAKIRGVWIEGIWNSFEPQKLAWIDKKKDRDKKRMTRKKKKKDEPEEDKLIALSPIEEDTIFEPKTKLSSCETPQIWTSGKRGILKKSDLLIIDGKIKQVGRGITAPEGAHVINAKGHHVTPGLIDAHNHSMILGMVNEGNTSLLCHGLYRRRRQFRVARGASPTGRRPDGGESAPRLSQPDRRTKCGHQAASRRWAGDMKFKARTPGIKFALGENVKQSNWGDNKTTRFPQTRMGVPAFHENRFTAAWQYNREWRRFREKEARLPGATSSFETLGQIITADRWIHCHSYRQDEILAFLRTMEQFGVRVGTLQHVLEGYKVADEIAAHGAGGSCFADWWGYKYEVIDAIPYAGSLMRERGVVVSFNSDSSDLARRMNLESAKAVKYGNTKPADAPEFCHAESGSTTAGRSPRRFA